MQNRGKKQNTLQGGYGEYDHNTYWYGAQFSQDNRLLCYGFVDQIKKERTIFIHAVGGNWPIISKFSWKCENCGPGNIAFSPNGQLIVHGGDGVRIFKVEPPGELKQIWAYSTKQPIPQHSLCFSAKGTWLSYADGETVHVHKVSAIPTGICLDNLCFPAPYWVVLLVSTIATVIQVLQFIIP